MSIYGFCDNKCKHEVYTKEEVNTKLATIVVLEGENDLNNYLEEGKYYFSSKNTPTNIPAGTNGWLEVVNNRGNEVKQLWYRHGTANKNDTETYIRTKINEDWSNWKRFANEDDFYYKNGDTYTIGATYSVANGFISSDSKTFFVNLYVTKSLKNISSVNVNDLHIRNARGSEGYILSNTSDTEFKAVAQIVSENCIKLQISNIDNSAFSATNNTLVSLELMNVKIEFNV